MGLLKKKCHGGKMSGGGSVAASEDHYRIQGVHRNTAAKGMSKAGHLVEEAGQTHKEEWAKKYDKAKELHSEKLEELKSMPKPKLLAHGGEADYESSCTDDCNQPCEVHEMGEDLVGQVMANRMSKGGVPYSKMEESDKPNMSEGGKVANSDLPEADFMPNEFDDLHLRDGLESSYDGANSGDESGDAENDSRLQDMVSRVMMKRRKQHNPRPA